MAKSLSQLCQLCGLCCDGSLFKRVPLGVTEIVPDIQLRVVTQETGARYVPQRCAALKEVGCQVYLQRPLACRRYECLLLSALKEGELSLPEALRVVRKAKLLMTGMFSAAEKEEFFTFHFGRRS